MTDVIYKYPVHPEFELQLPIGSQVLAVQLQQGEPQMWVLQNRAAGVRCETRKFVAIGTGHSFDQANHHYICTFQQPHLGLVWHVFEVSEQAQAVTAPAAHGATANLK